MSPGSVPDLVNLLHRQHLLSPTHADELTPNLASQFTDPRLFAKDLVKRGWLTPWQVNQLFLGRGQDLSLGSYVLLEKLGEGGMGDVFKARNWKLDQTVALKLNQKGRLARGIVP